MTGGEGRGQEQPDLVAKLRRAAAVLRVVDRDHPRGPWRWGNPDPATAEVATAPLPVPGHRTSRTSDDLAAAGRPVGPDGLLADPLATFEDLLRRPAPRGPAHPSLVETSLAGPLADLLDALADAADSGAPPTEPYRRALHVAEVVQTAAGRADVL